MSFIIPVSELPGNTITGCGPCLEEDSLQSNATHIEIEIDPDDSDDISLTGLCPTHVLDHD